MPRPYRTVQRYAAAEQTRAAIVDAARRLLAGPAGVAAFTIDAVAREAGVARMTVYYQFGSKAGLLEAMYDDIAAKGELAERIPAAFQQTDAREVLAGIVGAFTF